MGTDAPHIFLNYRREDTGGDAQLLYERLAEHFGADHVFLDVENNEPGMLWLDAIKDAAGKGVFLALIGPRWLRQLKERERRASSDDILVYEIEHALRPGSPVRVIPVLIGDAVPPMVSHLPRSLWPLAKIQVARIREDRRRGDTEDLIARIRAIAAEPDPEPEPKRQPEPEPTPDVPAKTTGRFKRTLPPFAPAPDEAHLATVMQYMAEGTVVPVLGPGTDLAGELAKHFKLDTLDLPEIAQYVSTTRGEPDLYMTLKRILSAANEPGPVHKFLASVPQRLEALGEPQRHQLIVTTNFDTALEEAFDRAQEPYDLAIYMVNEGRPRFVHFPYDGEPTVIEQPNKYSGLPIGEMREIQRTLIVKIHGAVDGKVGEYSWAENYVVTEDHYIQYLSHDTVANLIPVQILDTLRGSHCLLLGYRMHDWHLRVFLERVWRGRIKAESWAIQPDPGLLDKKFWVGSNVELLNASMDEYVALLDQQLASWQPAEA